MAFASRCMVFANKDLIYNETKVYVLGTDSVDHADGHARAPSVAFTSTEITRSEKSSTSENINKDVDNKLPDEKQLVGEENWRPFKCEISFAVQARGLTGYMDGTTPKPTPTTENYPRPIYQAAPTPAYSVTPCLEEWVLHDRLVAGAIVSNIADPIGLGIDETKRASEIWQSLIKRYTTSEEPQRTHNSAESRYSQCLPTGDRT
ncbi:hypothetical protein EV359DRAFT_65754 [Lentinula novae-zelandiae]|nr:hypothetical protein EV359DRAFT_65754 [Lentinula novae-zelandiae]